MSTVFDQLAVEQRPETVFDGMAQSAGTVFDAMADTDVGIAPVEPDYEGAAAMEYFGIEQAPRVWSPPEIKRRLDAMNLPPTTLEPPEGGPTPWDLLSDADQLRAIGADIQERRAKRVPEVVGSRVEPPPTPLLGRVAEWAKNNPVGRQLTTPPIAYLDPKTYREMGRDIGPNIPEVAPADQWGAPMGPVESWQRDPSSVLPLSLDRVIDDGMIYAAVSRLKQTEDDYAGRAEDIDLIERFTLDLYERQARGMNFMGHVSVGIKQLIPWMLEFMATGGVAGTGRKAGEKVAGKAIGKYASTKAGRVATKTAGLIGSGVARTLVMPHRVGQEYFQNSLPQNMAIDDDGKIAWSVDADKPATAFLRAFGSVFIENMTEETGEGLVRGGKRVLGKVPGMGKLAAVARDIRKLIPEGKYAKWAASGFSKAGYDGIIGEIGEERLGEILRAALKIDRGMEGMPLVQRYVESLPGWKALGAEAVTLAVPGAVRMAASTIGGRKSAPPPTAVSPTDTTVSLPDELGPVPAEVAAAEVAPAAPQEPEVAARATQAPVEVEPAPEAQPTPEVAPQAPKAAEGDALTYDEFKRQYTNAFNESMK